MEGIITANENTKETEKKWEKIAFTAYFLGI